ncbi:maltokinase N-terminal cap-like domain-containing protein [Streptomyces purpureus]|uniref:maltokinase N-terminal cap-like domain-containing protein n=1 Tax=Streptomyces purpureus TaxID=1951 RepID=UPI00037604A5|nr:hypothetical protein [Streptomyces purpureus]
MTPPALAWGSLEHALKTWLPRQRWYPAKNRPLSHVSIAHTWPFTPTPGSGPGRRAGEGRAVAGVVLVTRAHFADGRPTETYQIPVGIHPAATPAASRPHDPATIAHLDGTHVYEATADPHLIGHLTGRPVATTRPLNAEQTNTSLIVDETHVLKIFRRLHTGTNPDLELQRALRPLAADHTPPLAGAVEGDIDGRRFTYALITRYLPAATDGWQAALAALATPHADFTADAHAMGTTTGRIHTALATAFPTRTLDTAGLTALAAHLTRRYHAARALVPALARHERAVYHACQALTHVSGPVRLQRIHGDLHLGQWLRCPQGWLLTDFEGEPAQPIDHRTRPHSTHADIAAMLRSFDYAAHHTPGSGPAAGDGPRAAAARFAERAQQAFLDGYTTATGDDPRHHPVLLRAHLLDKALYEAAYETTHRPQRAAIPLAALDRLTEGDTP